MLTKSQVIRPNHDKQSQDIFGVSRQFEPSVWECKLRGSDCSLPGEHPIPCGMYTLCGLGRSVPELKISNLLNRLRFMGGGVSAREDGVQVDGSSQKDISPLRIGEPWYSRC